MIAIDFQGGSHGNFLEFVCNKMIGITADKTLPFNSNGAAHSKSYTGKKYFECNHYSFTPVAFPLETEAVILIKIQDQDLLPLSQISLLRAGDLGIDNDCLEIDTYHKLNTINYRWVLDELIDAFFTGQITKSYDAVKDPSWPAVHSLKDFANLPEVIQAECKHIHNLELMELTEEQPHCPRHILQEFFQLGFENPDQQGFIKRQKQIQYPQHWPRFEFYFSNFYNQQKFMDNIQAIASWANISYNDWHKIENLHQEFLARQPYKHSKIQCDKIVEDLCNGINIQTKLTMIEEAYVNAQLKIRGHECRY